MAARVAFANPEPATIPRATSMRSLRVERNWLRAFSARGCGFDNKKYLEHQKAKIMERLRDTGGEKLYIEFGGKLLFDFHAARVLPGYDPNVKIDLLRQLSSDCDIILCVNANDIERHKVRVDFGITYDEDAMRIIDDLWKRDIPITAVVITQFSGQQLALGFKTKLEQRQIKVYLHPQIPRYPADIDTVVSERGYGMCEYIETTKKIVVVTAPGPGSGKLATCLSQLYHEFKRNKQAGYAKFETFPVWNLPLKHPVNVAYEAATLDLHDANMIDYLHKEAYGVETVNYNRDLEAFPVLKQIFERITGSEPRYKSPTDMGVNCIADGIIDDKVCCEASRQEIIRRYLRCQTDFVSGRVDASVVGSAEKLLEELNIKLDERSVVPAARKARSDAQKDPKKGNRGLYCGAALQIGDGTIFTGKNSPALHSAAAVLLNAVKHLAQIPDDIDLIPPIVFGGIGKMKEDIYQSESPSLDVTEMLIALAVSRHMNPMVDKVLEKLSELYGSEMHLTHIPMGGDVSGLCKLGIQFTSDPQFATRKLA